MEKLRKQKNDSFQTPAGPSSQPNNKEALSKGVSLWDFAKKQKAINKGQAASEASGAN
jgi:hypothetical protein